MLDLIAALLLGLGGAATLLAAIGVARFPDAFTRMHAATKAGAVGAGLTLAGVALAFADSATTGKIVVAILLLLATTPIAGHVLGRAAWLAAAPIAEGTQLGTLAEALPRPAQAFDQPVPAIVTSGERPMLKWPPTIPPPPTPAAGLNLIDRLEDVRLAVAASAAMPAATRCAIDLATRAGARLSVIVPIDTALLSARMATPAGGLHHAARLARSRLERARDAAANAARDALAAAAAAGLSTTARFVEAPPSGALFAGDRGHSLVVMPDRAWFDHGIIHDPDAALAAQCTLDAAPLLLAREPVGALERAVLLHEGSNRSMEALLRFAGHPFLRDREAILAGVGDCSEEALNRIANALMRQGHHLEIAGRFAETSRTGALAACLGNVDVIVAGRDLYPGSWIDLASRRTWRVVRASGRPLLLL
jgi:monovalent cation/proton antiporter MnhG/PhaG subunit